MSIQLQNLEQICKFLVSVEDLIAGLMNSLSSYTNKSRVEFCPVFNPNIEKLIYSWCQSWPFILLQKIILMQDEEGLSAKLANAQ